MYKCDEKLSSNNKYLSADTRTRRVRRLRNLIFNINELWKKILVVSLRMTLLIWHIVDNSSAAVSNAHPCRRMEKPTIWARLKWINLIGAYVVAGISISNEVISQLSSHVQRSYILPDWFIYFICLGRI